MPRTDDPCAMQEFVVLVFNMRCPGQIAALIVLAVAILVAAFHAFRAGAVKSHGYEKMDRRRTAFGSVWPFYTDLKVAAFASMCRLEFPGIPQLGMPAYPAAPNTSVRAETITRNPVDFPIFNRRGKIDVRHAGLLQGQCV